MRGEASRLARELAPERATDLFSGRTYSPGVTHITSAVDVVPLNLRADYVGGRCNKRALDGRARATAAVSGARVAFANNP
jgi:hypothetical protein